MYIQIATVLGPGPGASRTVPNYFFALPTDCRTPVGSALNLCPCLIEGF